MRPLNPTEREALQDLHDAAADMRDFAHVGATLAVKGLAAGVSDPTISIAGTSAKLTAELDRRYRQLRAAMITLEAAGAQA